MVFIAMLRSQVSSSLAASSLPLDSQAEHVAVGEEADGTIGRYKVQALGIRSSVIPHFTAAQTQLIVLEKTLAWLQGVPATPF